MQDVFVPLSALSGILALVGWSALAAYMPHLAREMKAPRIARWTRVAAVIVFGVGLLWLAFSLDTAAITRPQFAGRPDLVVYQPRHPLVSQTLWFGWRLVVIAAAVLMYGMLRRRQAEMPQHESNAPASVGPQTTEA